MKLNQRLKELRQERHITQKTVADAVGIATRNMQHFEYGTAKPKLDTVIKFADYYDVSTDYLLGRSDNPQRL